MMDHYEEWGIPRSASTAEIRQAYRRLMQLLHPDHCADDAGRRLAELQSKRLNAILAILTDPLERERYDRRLAFEVQGLPPPPPPWPKTARARLWPAAATVLALVLLTLAGWPKHTPTAPDAPIAAVPSVQPTAPRQPIRRAISFSPRVAPGSPVIAGNRPPETTSAELFPEKTAPSPPQAPPEPESSAWIAELPAPAVAARPGLPRPPPTMAGEWLAFPDTDVPGRGAYPSEYVELRVTEAAGVLRGRYRARYKVSDLAISPVVAFEFEGPASASESRFPWIGPGNARGQVTLRLRSSGVLEVSWVVEQMGSELGLIAGNSTLVRRAD